MGQFISVTTTSLEHVSEAIAESVKDTKNAIYELDIITASFTPGIIITPPNADKTIGKAASDALTAAKEQTKFIFESQFPGIGTINTDYGVVLDYQADGDIQTVINAISDNLSAWGYPTEPASADISNVLKSKVGHSDFTPSVTYGVIDSVDPENPEQQLHWVASFAVFHLSIEEPAELAVIYGFSAVQY